MRKIAVALCLVLSLALVGIIQGACPNCRNAPMLGAGDPALPINGGWVYFQCSGCGQPFNDEGPFTFTSIATVTLEVTDAFCTGDQFRIYDNGTPIGDTNIVASDYPDCYIYASNPDVAWASSNWSHGSFLLSPGSHSITIQILINDYCGGGAFLRARSPVSTLTVGINPTGGGTVTGTGISCPGDCTETVNNDTNIVLTATPSIGYHFTDWTGCDTPSGNTCTMTMTQDKTVTANFTLNTYALTVNINPAGGGTVTGTGISCPGDCTDIYNYNTNVTLTATPATGYTFVGWSGCDAPSGNTCTMTMTADKTVTANFTMSPKKKVVLPSMLPVVQNNITKGNDLLKQVQDLLSQAKDKNLDTAACEKLVTEAKELLTKSAVVKTNPIYANNLALGAIGKLKQAIECLKALLG